MMSPESRSLPQAPEVSTSEVMGTHPLRTKANLGLCSLSGSGRDGCFASTSTAHKVLRDPVRHPCRCVHTASFIPVSNLPRCFKKQERSAPFMKGKSANFILKKALFSSKITPNAAEKRAWGCWHDVFHVFVAYFYDEKWP